MHKKSVLAPVIARRINQKLKRFLGLAEGQKPAFENLKNQALIDATYNSCALAGNTLTLSQTKTVIQKKVGVGGKPIQDLLETHAYFETLSAFSDPLKSNSASLASVTFLETLYKAITGMQSGEKDHLYRTSDFTKTTPIRKLPSAKTVRKGLVSYCRSIRAKQKMHPVELAAWAHHALLALHPYADANGRLARAFTELMLQQKGFTPVVILYNDRKRYESALKRADRGDLAPLVSLFAQSAERALDTFLRALEPPTPGLHEFYLPLSRIAQRFPYSKKYLNLLIRSGKLEAYKKGRNWVTSYEAVKRYIDQRQRKRVVYP